MNKVSGLKILYFYCNKCHISWTTVSRDDILSSTPCKNCRSMVRAHVNESKSINSEENLLMLILELFNRNSTSTNRSDKFLLGKLSVPQNNVSIQNIGISSVRTSSIKSVSVIQRYELKGAENIRLVFARC